MRDSGQTAEEEYLMQRERSAYDERAELESDDEYDVEWERMEYVRCNRLPPDHLDGWSSDALKNLDDFLRDNTEICRRMNVERRVCGVASPRHRRGVPPGCTTEQRTTAGVPRELDTAEHGPAALAPTWDAVVNEAVSIKGIDQADTLAELATFAAAWSGGDAPPAPKEVESYAKQLVRRNEPEKDEQHYQVMLTMQSIPTVRK